MQKFIVIFFIFHLSHLEARTFKIKEGIYLMKNCFFKVSIMDELVHIQFAHRKQHLRDNNLSLGQQFEFHPDTVLGTNVFYDLKDRAVVFGPDKCGQGMLKRVHSSVKNKTWSIRCGGLFKQAKVRLKMVTDVEGRLRSFSFKEAFNSSHRGRYTLPWRKSLLYNFSCHGFTYEKINRKH